MATQGMFNLFGATPEEIRAKYEQSLMGEPRGGGLGRQLGYSLGRMLGGRVPGEAEAEARQQAMKQALESGEVGSSMYTNLARQYEAAGDYGRAFAAMQEAKRLKTEEEAQAYQESERARVAAERERQLKGRMAILKSRLPKEAGFSDEQLKNIASDNESYSQFVKAPSTSEFERVLASSGLPKDKQDQLRKEYLANLIKAKDNSENPLELAKLQAQLTGLLLQAQATRREMTVADRKERALVFKDIQKYTKQKRELSVNLSNAKRALDLWKGDFLNLTFYNFLSSNVFPFPNEAKSLKNYVDSLLSGKALAALMSLKAESPTGASGFGALNIKELETIQTNLRNLKPNDPNFKGQLLGLISDLEFQLSQLDEAIAENKQLYQIGAPAASSSPAAAERGAPTSPATTERGAPAAPAVEGRKPLSSF